MLMLRECKITISMEKIAGTGHLIVWQLIVSCTSWLNQYPHPIRSFEYMYTVLFCRFGSTTRPIWLDNVRCSGTESRLTSCSRNSYGSHNCVHSEDVAIDCSATTTGNFTVNPVHKYVTRLWSCMTGFCIFSISELQTGCGSGCTVISLVPKRS